jgi:uncharacterized protein YdhG (YjbR/CyaY superfamily)
MPKPKKAKDIDGYISQFPANVEAILQKVRATISSAAPDAKETISYLMPAFRLHLKGLSHATLDRRAISSFP